MLRLFDRRHDLSITRGGNDTVITVSKGSLRSAWSAYSDTLGTQVLTAALGLASGVLAARLLGPARRGELAAVLLWPVALGFVFSLGIDRATVFFAGKHRDDASSVETAALAFAGLQAALVILIGLAVIPRALGAYGPQAVRLGELFLIGVPLMQAVLLQSNVLLGHLETRSYNASRAIAPAWYTLSVAVLFLMKQPSVRAIVLLYLAGLAVAAIVVYRLVRRKLHPVWRWQPATAKAMLGYGAKTHAGELTSFMNQRLDQLLISLFLPGAQLGIYVAAVAFADSLLIIPKGIGVVTLAKGSNAAAPDAWRCGRRSLLLAAAWLIPGSLALWFLCPVVIPRLLGTAFAPAVIPCRILLLGSCALGLRTVVYEAARGANRPEIPSYAEGVGLVITVALLAALLKPYGIIGAAAASTVAYTASLTFTLVYLLVQSRPEFRALMEFQHGLR
jgi:O-antigen/teichoic acid export membrane protein